MTLRWEDAEEIGYQLYEAHPDTAPLKLRFTDLHRMVTELEDFDDDPKRSSEGLLEKIQMVWYEEWKEDQD